MISLHFLNISLIIKMRKINKIIRWKIKDNCNYDRIQEQTEFTKEVYVNKIISLLSRRWTQLDSNSIGA